MWTLRHGGRTYSFTGGSTVVRLADRLAQRTGGLVAVFSPNGLAYRVRFVNGQRRKVDY